MAEQFWKQNTYHFFECKLGSTMKQWSMVQHICSRKKWQLFVFMSVFKKKNMAIDHLFRAISLFCGSISIALSMNKHVSTALKRKEHPNKYLFS